MRIRHLEFGKGYRCEHCRGKGFFSEEEEEKRNGDNLAWILNFCFLVSCMIAVMPIILMLIDNHRERGQPYTVGSALWKRLNRYDTH